MRRALFAAAVAAATVLFLLPLAAPPAGAPGVGWDKVAHVAVFAALGLLAARAWPSLPRAALFGALVAYGAAVEFAQAALPWRSAEVLDLVADAAGAALVFAPPRAR